MDEQQYPRGDGSDIVRNQDRVFEAIRMSGGLLFMALVLSAALAWHWINMRFEAQRAELAGKAECFDALREKLIDRRARSSLWGPQANNRFGGSARDVERDVMKDGDAMFKILQRREGGEVPVPRMQRESTRGDEPPTAAPLREKR